MADIVLEGLSKRYPRASNLAVKSLDLVVPDGEFVCLLGPSGCGKTTTLRMVAGLETPSEGRITIGDRMVFSDRERIFIPPEDRDIGMMFQSYALWPHMTVRQNVEFALKVRRQPAEVRRARVDDVLEMLQLEGLGERLPSNLSGGQQQRVALARMLATQPDVLLLDEPLSNLDAKLRLEMRTGLLRLHHELGLTVVFVTHDQQEAMTMATTIVLMNEGTIEQSGTPMEIYVTPRSRFVADFVGSPPMNTFARDGSPDIWRWIAEVAGATSNDEITSIGVRPEAIEIRADGPGLEGLRAVVESVQPTGSQCIVSVMVDQVEIFALMNEQPPFTPGEPVLLSVQLGQTHSFDSRGHRYTARHGVEVTR